MSEEEKKRKGSEGKKPDGKHGRRPRGPSLTPAEQRRRAAEERISNWTAKT